MALSNPKTIFALGCVGIIMVALSTFTRPTALVIYNPSPSEPIGFYRFTTAKPAPGQLISFKVPEHGRAYAAQHLAYILRWSILKEIAAGQGSTVCADHAVLSIDGRARAKIADHDRQGAQLPHWQGCRRLGAGEYFVFSNRIPNSYDSRYYGPVSSRQVLGVYTPLWTW